MRYTSYLARSRELVFIQRQLRVARPDLDTDAHAFHAAVLLLCGPGVGFNIDRLARLTGYARAFVAICTRRLFDNGVWDHHGEARTLDSPEDPGFWRDVAVAEGRLCRRRCTDGRIEWAAPGVWKKHYDFVGEPNAAHTITYIAGQDSPDMTEVEERAEGSASANVKPAISLVVGFWEGGSEGGHASHSGSAVPTQRVRDPAIMTTLAGREDFFPNAQWL